MHVSVALHVGEGTLGTVDGKFMEVRTSETAQLGIEVGEETPLEKRVITEVDAWDDVTGAESDLLRFGEEVVRVAIQRHLSDHFQGNNFFRNNLGGVEDVKGEAVGCLLIEDLECEIEFGEMALVNCFVEVAAVVVLIGAADFNGLIPEDRAGAVNGTPVEFDKPAFAELIQ